MSRVARRMLAGAMSFVLLGSVGEGSARATVLHEQQNNFVDELLCVQPMIGSACYHGGAQTLTTTAAGELIAVDLPLVRQPFTTTTRDLTVEIHADTPDGVLLATSSPIPATQIPADLTADDSWTLVRFPMPVAVTAGLVLAIVIPIDPLSETPDPAWGWGKSASDRYAGGVAWGGSAPSSWDSYDDGSDLAFNTHIRTGPPDCDLALVVGAGDLIHDSVVAGVADARVEFYGFDFGSDTEATVEVRRTGAGPAFTGGTARTAFTDIDGDFAGDVVFKNADAGNWAISAYPADDPTCSDSVHVMVLARPTLPTGTPAMPPGPAELPDTSTLEPSSDVLRVSGALLAVALASIALLAFHRGPLTSGRR